MTVPSNFAVPLTSSLAAGVPVPSPTLPLEVMSYMCSGKPGLNGLGMRNNVVKMARLKHEQKAAPALCVVLHVAISDAGWRRGSVAHGGASILLRQYEALRAGDGEYSRGAGAGDKDGIFVGDICGNWESQYSGIEVGGHAS